jgi:hypothetical protein
MELPARLRLCARHNSITLLGFAALLSDHPARSSVATRLVIPGFRSGFPVERTCRRHHKAKVIEPRDLHKCQTQRD